MTSGVPNVCNPPFDALNRRDVGDGGGEGECGGDSDSGHLEGGSCGKIERKKVLTTERI